MVSALLDPKKGLATHFGAIVTLHLFGQQVVDALLVENVQAYGAFLKSQEATTNERTRAEAAQVRQALLAACGEYLRWRRAQDALPDGPLPPANTVRHHDALVELFGAQLDPYLA